MSQKPVFPQLFKGIALFTPGGDLIYGIDPSKQGQWHLHLCAGLQELLGLPEPPHFLVPGYTATIDRWIDPKTQQLRTSAEIYWSVRHHQMLLNTVFDAGHLVWQVAPWQEESCDPMVLETYRHHFPQLWEDHDLIVRFDRAEEFSYSYEKSFAGMEGFMNNDASLVGSTAFHWTTPRYTPHRYSYEESYPTNSASEYAIANPQGATVKQPPSDSEGIDAYSPPLDTHGYVLRLFVSGHSAATAQTLKLLHQFLEHSLCHPYTLKVIDIFKHPDQAEANQILATPTLLRVWPEPIRRIVGDLNNVEQVLRVIAAPEE